jgi:hypothetical protein
MTIDGIADYVRQVREATQRYAKDLLDENEKLLQLTTSLHAQQLRLQDEVTSLEATRTENDDLRAHVESLNVEKLRLSRQLGQLTDQLERHRALEAKLKTQMVQLESANERFVSRYDEIEQYNSNLANLYVASYRLHGNLDRQQVVSTIHEIVINLIGSEQFAILEDVCGELVTTSSVGVATDALRDLERGDGPVVGCIAQGAVVLPEDGRVTACIPLKVGARTIGVIAIVRLLAHKPALEAIDHELFGLLATHAASALYCSDLHARVADGARRASTAGAVA